MRLDFAKYTPIDSCDNIRTEHRGGYNIFVLSNGKNEPKGTRKITSKISKVLIESFSKRPSLKDIAFEKLLEIANNAVFSAQSPNFRVQCETLFLALHGNKIRWSRNGDLTLLHFADGELVSRTETTPSLALGEDLNVEPEIYEVETLDNKDHFFVGCYKDFEGKLSIQNIERNVRNADSAQDLLNNLLYQFSQKGGDENTSIFVFHLPPRKKKISLFILIPIIVAILFFIIGALGKMRPPM